MVNLHRKKLWHGNFDIRDYEDGKAKETVYHLTCDERPDEFMILTQEEFEKHRFSTNVSHRADYPLPNGQTHYKLWSVKWIGKKAEQLKIE